MKQNYWKIVVILFLSLLTTVNIFGQTKNKCTLSGTITDKSSGEALIGAVIYVSEVQAGTTTNEYGFYSLTLPCGTYNLTCSYMGYESLKQSVTLDKAQKQNFELQSSSLTINEVTITEEKKNKNVEKVEMSTNQLPIKTIKQIPALMGEVDLIKTIQLLPGVKNSGEGSSGFYVRGGGVDQNLILIDEATVFNSSHLFGLFSVFNPDAVKDVKLIKGGIPAEYGGRLSSVLDIRMKDGNVKKFHGDGGIGILSSRLTLEGPIIKEKASFVVSARRTYFDLFFPAMNEDLIKRSRAYFYDLSAKVNFQINENNRLFISAYSGKDMVRIDSFFKMFYGNNTLTIRYNHVFNNRLFANTSLIYSKYTYGLGAPSGSFAFEWTSYIINRTLRHNYEWFISPNNKLKFGIDASYYTFQPGKMEKINEESSFNDFSLMNKNAMEIAAFVSNELTINRFISLDYGLRFSFFQNIGNSMLYHYNTQNPKKYPVTDSTYYSAGKVFGQYSGLEPRAGLRIKLDENTSIKASYNHMKQYIHMATNSYVMSPFDLWFPSSPNIKPQVADQLAVGLFKNFMDNSIETSVEAYYKYMQNSIDYCDHTNLLANKYFEGEMRIGNAYAYGLEFMVKKNSGKLNGWISYTWSRTFKDIPSVNSGKAYPAAYDKPHDIAVVLSYALTNRLNVSVNWVYSSGMPRIFAKGKFSYENKPAPVYSGRNEDRLDAYHRMDLALTLDGKKWNQKKPTKSGRERWKYETSWTFSIYNLYNRHNTYSVNFRESSTNPGTTEAERMYLFKIFPSLTYNFKF